MTEKKDDFADDFAFDDVFSEEHPKEHAKQMAFASSLLHAVDSQTPSEKGFLKTAAISGDSNKQPMTGSMYRRDNEDGTIDRFAIIHAYFDVGDERIQAEFKVGLVEPKELKEKNGKTTLLSGSISCKDEEGNWVNHGFVAVQEATSRAGNPYHLILVGIDPDELSNFPATEHKNAHKAPRF